jgi:hypothetical protein
METLVIDNKLYRFNTEYEHSDDLTRRAQLKAIADKLKGHNSNNLEKFNQILKNIQTVQNKKPYHRLNLFQKEQIVKDYVFRTWGDSKVESYTKQILKFIENKAIVTQNVVYNIETGELNNIKNICVKDDKIILKEKIVRKTKDKEEKEKEESEDNTDVKEVIKKEVIKKEIIKKEVKKVKSTANNKKI